MERFSKTWGICFFHHMYALDGEKETDERLQKMLVIFPQQKAVG